MKIDYSREEALSFYLDRGRMPGIDIEEKDTLDVMLKKARFSYDYKIPLYFLYYYYNAIRNAHYNLTLIQNAGYVIENVSSVNGARTPGNMFVAMPIDYVEDHNMNRFGMLSSKFWQLDEMLKANGKRKDYNTEPPENYAFKPIEALLEVDTRLVIAK